MIRGAHQTAPSTPDLDRMLAFYRDLLGFEVVAEFAWPAGTELADRITSLAAAGMTFHCPPHDLGPDVRPTDGRDPDGNVLEL